MSKRILIGGRPCTLPGSGKGLNMHCINYAHRGASEYYPENTLFSFYMGLTMGADGIETDIQRTKDGVLVLFHDDTMERLLGRKERIADFTYEQLLAMDFGLHKGEAFRGEKIVTLEEFLLHFGEKPLTFALEIKQAGVEADTIRLLEKYGVKDKTILTSFLWDSLIEARRQDAKIRIGYLTETVDEALLERMKQVPMQQLCPRVNLLSDEMFHRALDMGFSVRFWGIANDDLMRSAMREGSAGMTINDPAELTRALQTR